MSSADNGDIKNIVAEFSSINNRYGKRKGGKRQGGKRQGRVGPACDLNGSCQSQYSKTVTLSNTVKLNDILPTTGAGDTYYYYQVRWSINLEALNGLI